MKNESLEITTGDVLRVVFKVIGYIILVPVVIVLVALTAGLFLKVVDVFRNS